MSFGTIQAEKVTTESGYSLGAGNASSFKNRLINGAMTIDQRNAGGATANTINGYTLDRWIVGQTTTGKLIAQQNAGSVTPPSGFKNYLGLTSQSAYSVGASDTFQLLQYIEGYNIADLGWGTVNAKPVVLSFWVYSSLTGTFGGSIYSASASPQRSYPFSYTVSSANTWTQITIPVTGDTGSVTYLSTNGAGFAVNFGLGSGSTYSTSTAGWQNGVFVQPTGTTSVVATNGATFYITGVQLEVGTVATSFDFRSYGTELALCQRYFQKYTNQPSAYLGNGNSARNGYLPSFIYPVKMRTAPTASNITGFAAGNATTYAFSSPSIVTTADGLYEIYGIASVAINYSEPFCAFFSTLDLSAEL